LGPGPGNLSQNGQKPTPPKISLTKKRNPKPKTIFLLLTSKHAKSFEGFNSSLAQSTGELWSCEVVQK